MKVFGRHMERPYLLEHGRGVVWRHFGLARHPLQEITVRHLHEGFVHGQLFVAKLVDVVVREASQHEVHLAHSPMPGAKQNAPAARVQTFGAANRACHLVSVPILVYVRGMSAPDTKTRQHGATRPSELDPLFAPVSTLPGVGPKLAALLAKLVGRGGKSSDALVRDLVLTPPHSIIDRTKRPGIANSPEGAIVTLEVRVDRHVPAPRDRRQAPHRVYAHDDTGEVALTFFRARTDWLMKALPEGETVIVSGRMEWFNGRPTMTHPDYIAPLDRVGDVPMIEPIYPLTAGLQGKTMRKVVRAAVERVPTLPDWMDAALAKREGFPPHDVAIRALHNPKSADDLEPHAAARRRLAYDELLAGQLALALVRQRSKKLAGRPMRGDGRLRRKVLNALPYRLTNAQDRSVKEIASDLASTDRMLRLLQGDVGAGKTVVALMAMCIAAEAGMQSALMAPTEILARQHAASIKPLAEAAGLEIAVLTGRDKGADRRDVLDGLRDGSIDIVMGTHALFQEAVEYRDLGLVVIDEQHRFGVHQRLLLSSKGIAPDTLVMTATPIPRTLVLGAFGDMDVSKLDEKPPGRRPIKTTLLARTRVEDLVGRMLRAVEDGEKIYWICPLVEESEEMDLMSAEQRWESLHSTFGDKVGLVHGRMAGPEKDSAMMAFKDGETRILVATTVIEVGVDVPDASIIVIEHAERFGLAQLHQLRGRVGRGDRPSSCVLLYEAPLGEVAQARLEVMRETEDGFRIAEEDLVLRGEGDLLGTRQSGTPGFRIAQLDAHGDLLEMARQDARLVVDRDPTLRSERGEALRIMLYLHGRDEAVRLLRAG